jgi:hypothetical protein
MAHQTIEQQYNILMESRVTRLETIVENINDTNKNIRETLIRLESKVDKHFMWTVGIIVVFFGGTLASGILKAMHLIT